MQFRKITPMRRKRIARKDQRHEEMLRGSGQASEVRAPVQEEQY